MLAIAGGIILGVIGLLAILWLVGAVIENQEEVAQGCAFVVGLLIIIGIGAWLDSEWPEINWIKTAFVAIGCLIAALMAVGFFHDSPLLLKMIGKAHPQITNEGIGKPKIKTIKEIYFDIGENCDHDIRANLRYFTESNRIVFHKNNQYIVFYYDTVQYIVRTEDGSLSKFEVQDEAITYFTKFVLD